MKKRVLKNYISYDLEDSFPEEIDKLEENEKKKLLETGATKWMYAQKEITAGKIRELEIYPEFTRSQAKKDKSIKRKSNKQNDKNSRKRLERLINANFGEGDIWCTLTYDNEHMPESIEQAVKKMNYYIKKLNRVRKKKGLLNCRYVYVTEHCGSRCHHHIVMDGDLSMDEIEAAWPYGRRNNTRRIADDPQGVTGIARYIAKEPRSKKEKSRKRWNCSKGLKKPKERKNHQLTMKKIRQMRESDGSLISYIRKKYPDAEVFEIKRSVNPINGLYYFYVRMSSSPGTGRRE